MKHTILTTILAALLGTATAAPVISVSQNPGGPVNAGSTIDAGAAMAGSVTGPKRVNNPDGEVNVTFTGVPPGSYQPQRSIDGENNWSESGPPGIPDIAGTFQFTDFAFGPVIFYRLQRLDSTCLTFTITNTGDMPLTGLDAFPTGAGNAVESFMVDSSGFPEGGTLGVNESTQLTICFQPFAVGPLTITVNITGNGSPDFTFNVTGTGVSVDPGGDSPPAGPPPGFVLYEMEFVPATALAVAFVRGKIAGGPPDGEATLEYSDDLGQSGPWLFLDFIQLDAEGGATFGFPAPLALPGTVGWPRCFVRAGISPP